MISVTCGDKVTFKRDLRIPRLNPELAADVCHLAVRGRTGVVTSVRQDSFTVVVSGVEVPLCTEDMIVQADPAIRQQLKDLPIDSQTVVFSGKKAYIIRKDFGYYTVLNLKFKPITMFITANSLSYWLLQESKDIKIGGDIFEYA